MMTPEKPDSRNPQSRIEAINEEFGAYGVKWRYEIVDKWTEPGAVGEVCFLVQINLHIRDKAEDSWGHPIPGIGGSMLVKKREHVPYSSPEAPKIALADALSVAMTALGASSTD